MTTYQTLLLPSQHFTVLYFSEEDDPREGVEDYEEIQSNDDEQTLHDGDHDRHHQHL